MLPALETTRKSGKEPFVAEGNELPVSLVDFWQWYASDLTSNALRGVIAEFLVASALDCAKEVRSEWDAYDLITQQDLKIEVKSAAYIQSWYQKKFSAIEFGIAPTQGWDAKTNAYSSERRRQADIYVFCLLAEKDQSQINPLNADQWVFHVIRASELDRQLGSQKKLSISRLRQLGPETVRYSELKAAVAKVSESNEID